MASDRTTETRRMPLVPALEVLREVRGERIVISSMGTGREWPKLSRHPLDLHFVPSTMGGALPLGLGLALARPDCEVVVLSGDGSLLMSLGSLSTVVAAGATNLTLILFENGVYEVTGGQATAGARAGVDFTIAAQGCGWGNVFEYEELDEWRTHVASVLKSPGPRLIVLHVVPQHEDFHVSPPGPMAARVAAFREALAAR